jgi:hypothetical protein
MLNAKIKTNNYSNLTILHNLGINLHIIAIPSLLLLGSGFQQWGFSLLLPWL